MLIFWCFLLLIACFNASISESEALQNLFISVHLRILIRLEYSTNFQFDGNICFVFAYIKKHKLQVRNSKLNYRDYFAYFVILLVLKVYFPLVTQKSMINCTPHNQSDR